MSDDDEDGHDGRRGSIRGGTGSDGSLKMKRGKKAADEEAMQRKRKGKKDDEDGVRAKERKEATKKAKKEKKDKKSKKSKKKGDGQQPRSSVIIHLANGNGRVEEDEGVFARDYALDLDTFDRHSSSPRPLSASSSSSESKSDVDDDEDDQSPKAKGATTTTKKSKKGKKTKTSDTTTTTSSSSGLPSSLTSSDEAISGPHLSDEECSSSGDTGAERSLQRHSVLQSPRSPRGWAPTSRGGLSPPLSYLSRDLFLRIFGFLDWKSVCMVSCTCSFWRYVVERSDERLSEQKGVRNILWLFYLLDKIDEQIEIVMLMEEEERKKLQKLKEKKEAKEKSKKSKGKGKGESRVSEGKKSKKQSKKDSNNDDDSKPGAKKSKKKKGKKNGYAKQEAEFDMFQRSGTRIEFLKATVMLLRSYFKQNGLLQRKRVVPIIEYTRLLGILDKQLLETHSVLAQVISGELPMNENFDIIELTLRRYYSDFTLMFSPQGAANTAYKHPSRIITDDKARRVWEENVGKDVYFCNFRAFYKNVLRRETDLDDKEFKRYMKYFLNFPKDDTVSVAKWNTLTRLFGPYRKFYLTLHRYVIGTGFLGLINRIRAEEILKEYPNHVLIRFSRTAPLLLAFSENKNGVITHSTNGPSARKLLKLPETKENIPIDVYLEKVFPNSALVPMKVDGRLVARKDTYTDYVNTPSGFLCPSKPDLLWEND